jgi:hypothetical protein
MNKIKTSCILNAQEDEDGYSRNAAVQITIGNFKSNQKVKTPVNATNELYESGGYYSTSFIVQGSKPEMNKQKTFR